MTDDIVDRLRVLNHHAKKLAENESLHDLHRDALTRCENLTWQAADEIERLREERDEARREVCAFVSGRYSKDVVTLDRSAALEEAKQRGWDCFKGATDGNA